MGQGDLHVVLGAGGGAGSAVVRELLARGARLRAVQRRPIAARPGLETAAADLSDPAAARRACEGAAVIYHCVNAPHARWAKELLPLTRAVLDAASAAGARLVVMDNLYMYGVTSSPLAEDTPADSRTRKGRLRAESARLILDAHRAGRCRAVIGRASDFYGAGGANSVAGEWMFRDVLGGKAAGWPASLDQPHSLSYLEDVGRALALLGVREEALGQVWHLPCAAPVTGRQFLEMVFEALGRPPKMSVITPLMVGLAGLFVPFIREMNEMLYQWDRPFVVDDSRFRRAFGPFDVTPHRVAVERTVRWFQQHLATPDR
jgi:nucleoside-diphosphate-sugar epimerase